MVIASDLEFVIVGDLHLSAGYDPRMRVNDRNEDVLLVGSPGTELEFAL